MGWHREPQTRYGGEDYMTKFQREGSPKQPKRIPKWIITTLGLMSAIFATVIMGLSFGLKGLFASLIIASITTVIALNIKRRK